MAANAGGGGTGSSIILSPFFKLVFLTVLGLTILSLAVSLGLSLHIGRLGGQAKDLDLASIKSMIETCSTTFKLGFGAIVGLIGGKAIQ
jgi:hypothetical protein